MGETRSSGRLREVEKLGPMTTPNGDAGDAQPQTITATVQSIGPLPQGAYVIEGDVEFFALQGQKDPIDALTLDQAGLTAPGGPIPAKTGLEFTAGTGGGDSDGVR